MDIKKYEATKSEIDATNIKISNLNSQVELLNSQREQQLVSLGLDPNISDEELKKLIEQEDAELEKLEAEASQELSIRKVAIAALEEAIKNYDS